MDSAEARKSGRKTHPIRKAPLKPKNGLNGPPSITVAALSRDSRVSETRGAFEAALNLAGLVFTY